MQRKEIQMRLRVTLGSALLAVLICGATAMADQIILRDGTTYSGEFVRGDTRTVDFRILGRTENFQISDIAQILFSEPEVAAPPQALDQSEEYTPEPEPIPSPRAVRYTAASRRAPNWST